MKSHASIQNIIRVYYLTEIKLTLLLKIQIKILIIPKDSTTKYVICFIWIFKEIKNINTSINIKINIMTFKIIFMNKISLNCILFQRDLI